MSEMKKTMRGQLGAYAKAEFSTWFADRQSTEIVKRAGYEMARQIYFAGYKARKSEERRFKS